LRLANILKATYMARKYIQLPFDCPNQVSQQEIWLW
jgi:hypothetical protein